MSKKFTLLLLSMPLLMALTLPAMAQNTAINLVAASSQYVSTAVDVVPTSGTMTVELWVYVPSSGALDSKQHAFVFEGSNYGDFAFYLGYNGTTGEITAGDSWDNGSGGNTGITMPLDTWTHLALTADLTQGSAILYVNGKQVGSRGVGQYTVTGAGTPFQIGLQGDGTTYVNATIENVRVWNIQRTQAQLYAGLFQKVDNSTSGLVASYDMNETSTTDLTNNGSYGATAQGTLHGGVTRVSSPIQYLANAISLNGTNSEVDIAPNSAYDLTSGGTVEVWIKPDVLDGTNSTIIGNRGSVGANWSFHISSTAIGLWNNSAFNTVAATVPADGNTWTHLAFVYDGAGNTKVYENAGLIGTITGTPFSGITGQELTIGIAKPSNGEPFRGSIDEVRVWNTQRTVGEIAANKDITLTGSETGLVGEWSFDEGIPSGTNTGLTLIPDVSPTANSGTLANFALTGTSSNFIANTNITPLPVKLTTFTVVKQGTTALLQWQTASEQNSKDFSIQRSNDGAKYLSIGSVEAAGTSTSVKNYSFVDPSPVVGQNYYRLLQSDLDGKASYSPVKVLLFSNTGKLVWYSTGSHSVEVNLQQGSNELYVITDINGHLIRQGQLSSGKTSLSRLSAGIYVVKVITKAGETMNTKVALY